MKQINAMEILSPMLSAQWRRGVLTNAPFSPEEYRREISTGALYAQEFPGGLLLLRRRNGFYRMNFFLQPEAALPCWNADLPVVLEVPARPKDTALLGSGPLWEAQGFHLLFSRRRLVRLPGGPVRPPDSAVRAARPGDLLALQSLLEEVFDPRTGCLPTDRELEADIAAGTVLLAQREGVCAAVLHGRKDRNAVDFRHVAVRQSFRRMGLGTALLSAFDTLYGPARCRLWVRTDNFAAIHLYERLGYRPDGWTSGVWCREIY